jgi:DNA-directed RNA polymerase specialized sigma24 family protein
MSPQAGYVLRDEICPRLAAAIPRTVLCVGSEDHEELVQDAIYQAAKMIDRVEAQGKLGKVSASNISYYVIQHIKEGRRSNGISRMDIMAPGTQLEGSAKLHSIHEVVAQSECGNEIFELHDVISNNYDDPAIEAARRLDWAGFSSSLNRLEKLLIECLINGLGIGEAAELAKVSYWTMQDYRKKIAGKLIEYMGADILKDIASTPHWRIGLDCDRELMACRASRRG